MAEPALLSAIGLRAKYGARFALNVDSFTLKPGESVALIGPSGAGKSTFLRSLCLLQQVAAGEIVFRGTPVFRDGIALIDEDAYRREVSMVQQDGFLWLDKTVLENMSLPQRLVRGAARREADARSRKLLDRFQLGDFSDRYPNELSGGQRQRVALARTIGIRPTILILDEPTNNLDEEILERVSQILDEFRRDGGTTLIATHNIRFANRQAARPLYISNGRLSGAFEHPLIAELN